MGRADIGSGANAAHAFVLLLPPDPGSRLAVQARTVDPMTSLPPYRTTRPFDLLRGGALVALPLLAVGILRAFAPVELAADGALGTWLAPAAGALAAAAAATATLVVVVIAFGEDGAVAHLCAAAGFGALAAGSLTLVLAGPSGSTSAPGTVLPIALAAAGLALLAAEAADGPPVRGRGVRLVGATFVFAWIELPPAIGLMGLRLAPITGAAAGMGAALLVLGAAAAALRGSAGTRATALALLGAGALALMLARLGTLDVLPGMGALAAGCAAAAAAPVRRSGEAALRPVPLLPPVERAAEPPVAERLDPEPMRLARELRGTIAELIGARQAIRLQRDELARLRTIDEETDVASRSAILARLHLEAAGARRYAHPCALVAIDLDAMASLNRERGAEVGNAVLRELALRLRLRVREADAVGRIGGDTFLAILPHTDERGATFFAEAVRAQLTMRPVDASGGPVEATVSIGITILRPGDELTDAEALGRVEEALASARAAGGNRIAFDRTHGLARLDERDTHAS